MSGFFSSLKKEANLIAKEVNRGVDDLSRTAGLHASGSIHDLFRTGNVLQLVSRSSGKALQVVMSPQGHLVMDGMGPEGPTVYHAHWTVINEGNGVVRLHNNNNYIAIVNGNTCVVPCPNPAQAGAETKLRLVQIASFAVLESFTEIGKHLGVLSNGQLKSALATGRENDAHFGVRLIYTPYQPAGAAAAPAGNPPPYSK